MGLVRWSGERSPDYWGLGIPVVPSGLQCINIPHVLFKPIVDADALTDVLVAHRAGEGNVRVASFRTELVRKSLGLTVAKRSLEAGVACPRLAGIMGPSA
jgi:hypothetical protein